MAAMDLRSGEVVLLGKCLNYSKLQQSRKVITPALDGTVYAQSLGKAVVRYEVDIYVSSSLQRILLETAHEQCAGVTLYLRDNTPVNGVIESETMDWKEFPDGHGVAHFVIIKE